MTSSVTTTPTDINSVKKCDIENSSVIMNLDNSPTRQDNNTIDISITTEVSSALQTVLPTQTLAQALSTKTQVVPLVYIQTPPKLNIPFSTNKTSTSNVIVNAVPQFQLSNINNKNSNMGNQGVILTPVSSTIKSQQLVIQKSCNVQAVPVVPVSVASSVASKITGAYLTMLKPVGKPSETNRLHVNKIKTTDSLQFLTSSLSSISSTNHKYVIAPMPKVSTNRLPITATTNSVQPKIAFMPLTLPNSVNNNVSGKHKVFNFKITDGKLQNDNNAQITVMCDVPDQNQSEKEEDGKLICDEIINLDSPDKNEQTEEKSYELSIVEDSSSSKNDVSFTITIPDDVDKIKQTHKEVPPKYSKHGVSILKRSFNFPERKTEKLQQNSLIISPVPNSITTVSDANTKEVKITTPFENDEPVIVTEPKITPQKAERRRKSNFSYRKDYDDVEVTSSTDWDNKKSHIEKYKDFQNADITLTKLENGESIESNCKSNNVEDFVEIEVIKEKSHINMNDDDVSDVLQWEDGIGTLPGSDLKFQINEFGLLEFITKDEYKRMVEKKITRIKESKIKVDLQEELHCQQCGCYGMPSEFITSKYCSYDCQELGNKAKERELKMKKKKRKGLMKKPENNTNDIKVDKELSPSDDENSCDKFNYPWKCYKKGFSWAKYLEHIKAKSAPVKLFKDPFPYNRNGFRPGMKLEGVDPQHPSYFCVLTVAEVNGYRLRLHFDGYPENYDFWVNADSMNIFPPGWCEKYGHILHPPPSYTIADFNWNFYLKYTKSTAAPKHLFSNRAGNAICPNGFRVGMKLEAVDRKNTSLVCVATITDMMDNRILVHFDSWDDIYDYWADPTSPYIHPVGWCDQYGHNLTPPNGYPEPETFTWEKYLKATKSTAAPVRAFKQRPACGFKPGVRLECVDRRVPQLIRVATVDDVKDHQIRISFDGWPDRYGYWVDDDNPDIHPVGWCYKTGHPLEPPLTPDDVYDFLECPTIGCKGQGHIRGPKYATHSSQKHCPYAEENIDQERILPDRLLSPDRQVEAVVPVSREPREKCNKPKIGRPPKIPRLDTIKSEWNDEDSLDKRPKRKYKKRFKNDPLDYIKKENLASLNNGFTNNSCPEPQPWMKHSKYLEEFIKTDIDPREWTEDDVVDFVTSLPSCKDHGTLFSENNIDGEALLMLTQQDLVDILNIKLGPAIKLYSSIVLLRQNVNHIFT